MFVESLKKVWKTIVGVGRLLFKVLVIVFLILNTIFIVGTMQYMTFLDAKTDVMTEAFQKYHQITIESMTLVLKSQIIVTKSLDGIRQYVYDKFEVIENEIKNKTTLPNLLKLTEANVFIFNVTQGCIGSGTTFQMDGKTYIISAGHLDDPTDTFFVKERDEFRSIELIKVNHKVDLALFEYIGDYGDLTIAKLADKEPVIGDRVWAVGNPAGLEDAVTSGVIVRKMGFTYLIDAKIYYGSSGGGLFNTKGELIGVNVAMTGITGYVLGVSVNLRTIKAFIEGRIASEI